MDHSTYLDLLGVDPATVQRPDREPLARLQRAHVTTVPFETLAITGDPFGDGDGTGVSLDLADLYAKVVERQRGGFCYELNGLFGWLLAELGYDRRRVAARVVQDGELTPPASHHAHLVDLDKRLVVDVGLGIPTLRQPVPVDGTVVTDTAGVDWRVVESERPDADYAMQVRAADDDWRRRYVFETTARELDYFQATCDHLARAPESGFTGDPVVTMATDRGHRRLTVDTFTETAGRETVHERSVTPDEWHDVLEREFGLSYRSD